MRIKIVLACLVIASAACNIDRQQEKAPEKTAFHLNSLIGRGVNMGNALEAPEEGS